MLWIGSDASPQLLKDLLDVDDFLHTDPNMVRIFKYVGGIAVDAALRRFNSRYSQHGCQSKCTTLLLTGTHRGGGRPSCPSRGRTWTVRSSSLRTC